MEIRKKLDMEADRLQWLMSQPNQGEVESLAKNRRQVELATHKLERGTYGKCEICGRPIRYTQLWESLHAIICDECDVK